MVAAPHIWRAHTLAVQVLRGPSCRASMLHVGRHLVILHRGAHKICLAQHIQVQYDQHPAICMHSIIKLHFMHRGQILLQMP